MFPKQVEYLVALTHACSNNKFVKTVEGKILLLMRAHDESSKDIAPKNEEAKKEVLDESDTSGGMGLMHYLNTT